MNMKFHLIYYFFIVTFSYITQTEVVYGAVEPRPQKVSTGQKTNTSMYPHVVEVYIPVPDKTGTYCGGSIISDRWILTSGYCNYTVSRITATVGDKKKYEIKYALRHPEYKEIKETHNKPNTAWNHGNWTYNNYLMLHTVEYITFGMLVMKISIGTKSDIMDWRNGYVITYGPEDMSTYILNGEGSAKYSLFVVTVPLVTYKTCQSKSYSGFKEFTLMNDTEFCAGEYAIHPCGDPGSSIIAEGNLVGIFTIPHVSCEENDNSGPAIFASIVISSVRDWICDLSGV